MTHCTAPYHKTRARPTTQKEQYYFTHFSAVLPPKEDLFCSPKVIAFVMFGENLNWQ